MLINENDIESLVMVFWAGKELDYTFLGFLENVSSSELAKIASNKWCKRGGHYEFFYPHVKCETHKPHASMV